MAETSNGDMVRKTYDAFNSRDFEAAVQYVHEDLDWTEVASGRRYQGPEGMLREYREWARAFPDGSAEITNLVEGGEWVVVEFTVRGTNTGPMMGPDGEIPPTNKKIELQSCDVLRVVDGRVTGGRSYFDLNTVTRQVAKDGPESTPLL